MKNLLPWIRYLRHIPPQRILAKIAHDLRLKWALAKWPTQEISRLRTDAAGFDNPALLGFAQVYKAQGARFKNTAAIAHGVFDTKGVTHDFGSISAIRWIDVFSEDKSRINWLHDLCFFSFALPIADTDAKQAADVLCCLVRQLEENHPIALNVVTGQLPFVWAPIALALRIMGLSSAAAILRSRLPGDADSALAPLANHIAVCARLLDVSVERYLGYNHHVFGETALFVADLALGRASDTHLTAAICALETYLLDDGFWSERTPSYHIHMLLLAMSMAASQLGTASDRQKLTDLVRRMQSALACVVHPDREIAIFNDAAIDDSVCPDSVGWRPSSPPNAVQFLPVAGFARLEQGGTCVIMDAGPMGPNDVIGHGHGDFLSIEVSLGGQRLFVDPGVASIVNDAARQWTRSAALHNGPGIKGLEPAEFFGAWRVGRRGTARFDAPPKRHPNGTITVSGVCNGYKKAAGLVRRHLTLTVNGTLLIEDKWPLTPTHEPQTAFILTDEWSVTIADSRKLMLTSRSGLQAELHIACGELLSMGQTFWYPMGPMLPRHGTVLVFRGNEQSLDLSLQTTSSFGRQISP